MKKIFDIITYFAALAFMLSISSIDSMSPKVLMVLLVSSGWLIVYAMVWYETRRMRDGW